MSKFKFITLSNGKVVKAVAIVDADGNQITSFGGGGAVSSVFTRTGAVVAAIDDYTKEQIAGLKVTDSPTFAGAQISPDQDGVIELGRGKVGTISGQGETLFLSHFDRHSIGDYLISESQGGDSRLNARGGKTLILSIANTQAMIIDGSRNVKIGTTGTPTEKLEVDGRIIEQGTYGEIYVADAVATQSIPTGVTYTKCTLFTDNGLSRNCTADVANDKITATKTGRYKVSGTFNFQSGTANVVWEGTLFVNGTIQAKIYFKRKVAIQNDVGSAAFSGIIEVTTANQDIDFRVRHDNGAAANILMEYANLNIEYVGEI